MPKTIPSTAHLGIVFSILCFSQTLLQAQTDELTPLDEELQKHLQEEAGEDLGAGPVEPPLQRVANQMRQARKLMRQTDSQGATQRVQDNIVKSLDDLIQQQEKIQSKKSKSGGQSSEKPQKSDSENKKPAPANSPSNSSSNPGDSQAGTPTPGASNQAMREKSRQTFLQELWGHLPQRSRQRVSQEWGEEFLPKYELQLEEYFRRLAEESSRD